MKILWKDALGREVKTIGQRLQVLRNHLNISKEEFAKMLNITQKTLYNIEHDITEPRVSILVDISNRYDISLDYICKGK